MKNGLNTILVSHVLIFAVGRMEGGEDCDYLLLLNVLFEEIIFLL